EQLEQRFTSHATLAQRAVENPAELALEQPVLITKFLFLAKRDRVIGLLPARASWSVHSRRIIFPLERFRWPENLDTISAADLCFRSSISSHNDFDLRRGVVLVDGSRCAGRA